jgi:hypothetical protein
MSTELITLYGETDGTSTSGDFPLYSDMIYSTGTAPFTPPTFAMVPAGMKAKIWARRVSGDGETDVIIQWSPDVTVATPTWIPVERVKLASKGSIELEKRRPVVVRGIRGVEAFKISWSQPAAVKASVVVEVELTDEED